MREFRHKWTREGEITRLILGVVGLFVLSGILFFSLRATWGMYIKLVEASDNERMAQTQLLALRSQKQAIERVITELDSPRGLEEQLRQRYGVVKPGEGEIHIVAAQNVATSSVPQNEGVLDRLWHAFMVW